MRPRSFRYHGHRLAYSDYGVGDHTLILLPGLLLSRRMHDPLARLLTESGIRVVTLDFLGHGDSDHPRDVTLYSVPQFSDQVIALMDHLGLTRAVVGGTSLGANVTLDTAARHPGRLRGMVLEMPVLDNAIVAAIIAFAPLLVGLELGGSAARMASRAVGRIPRKNLPFYVSLALETLAQDPDASSCVLKGLFFDRVAPARAERSQIKTPALVVGHHRDPVHPFADADMLIHELPNATVLEASSILALRIAPERMSTAVTRFVNDCWRTRQRASGVHR